MSFKSISPEIQRHIPIIGDISNKSDLAYLTTRLATQTVNMVQMGVAEAYINGLEVPDDVLRSLFDTCMPVFFKHFPSLLAPYEWVLQETEQMAEGSKELMRLQYDLPQHMLNQSTYPINPQTAVFILR